MKKEFIELGDAYVVPEDVEYMNFTADAEYDDEEYGDDEADESYNMVLGTRGGGKVVIPLGNSKSSAKRKYRKYAGLITGAAKPADDIILD